MGLENNFDGTTFHHHFCVKTGAKCPEEFLCYSLAIDGGCLPHMIHIGINKAVNYIIPYLSSS